MESKKISEDLKTKFCPRCQARLAVNVGRCSHCDEPQLTHFEHRLGKLFAGLIPKHQAAYKLILYSVVVYFIIMTIDISMHPQYGIAKALSAPPGDLLYRWGAHVRGELTWWRLVTANFVHIGLMHIAFNGIALRYVTPYVARSYGTALTLASFVFLGTASMFCSNLIGAPVLVAGASGGVMAFIGMAAVSAHKENTTLSLQVRNSMLIWAASVFVFGFLMTYFSPMGIDNIAHFSGFVFGGIFGFILPKQSTTGFNRRWKIRLSYLCVAAAAVLTVLAFSNMASSSYSAKEQNACISNIHAKSFKVAEKHCAEAYKGDKSQTISYHNYILINIINGKNERAAALCKEGHERFKREEKRSFDGLCESIGHQ